MVLQIGAYEDGEFATVPICSRMQARDPQHLPCCPIERDEGLGLRVIDPSEPDDEFMAEILYRRKEASAQIVRKNRP